MDLISGYSQGGAPTDGSTQSLGQAARDVYQGLINPKAWQEVQQATQRTQKVIPSVLESLARGSVAQVPGTVGDISSLLRQLSPETMQQLFGNRSAPTTEEVLGLVPRMTPNYQGSESHEMMGGLLSPAMGYFSKAIPMQIKNMPLGLSIKNVDPFIIAQKNASLPIEQGGLGLPANNTAMDRAKAMGFDTPAYHGTKETNIESFDPSLGVGVSGQYKGANEIKSHLPYTWASIEPNIASAYSLKSSPRGKALDEFMQSINFDQVMASGTNKEKKEVEKLFKEWKKENPDYNKIIDAATIYPLLVKGQNPKIVNAKYETYSPSGKTKPNVLAEKSFSGRKNTGEHDLLMIENFNDPPITGWGGGMGTHIAIKDPSQIRSRFAAFDPKRIKEAEILAGALGLPLEEILNKKNYDKNLGK